MTVWFFIFLMAGVFRPLESDRTFQTEAACEQFRADMERDLAPLIKTQQCQERILDVL